jgi:hypothetical protein
MAGAFTHFLVSDFAKSNRQSLPKELVRILNAHASFLYLGSASPDFPYLSIPTGSVNWADVMHKQKTNSVVQIGQEELRAVWASGNEADRAKLAWLLGYVSHLVTDATIHPIVAAIVGDYESNKAEHRVCELTQDSLLYNLKLDNDITYANFSAMIKFCSDAGFFGEVMGFWKGLLQSIYSDQNEEPHPELWFTTYGAAIDTAEGDGGIVALFRHLGLESLVNSYTYRTREDIEQNDPDLKKKYFDKAKLPTGDFGLFTEHGFDKAVANVLAAWNACFAGLSTGQRIDTLVKNWDLDTGVDMDSPDKVITYWS